MKAIRFYIPLTLITSSLLILAITFKKAPVNNTVFVSEQQQQLAMVATATPKALNQNEIMTAKAIIESFAEKYSMPVAVNIQNGVIVIEGKGSEVLNNYDAITNFLMFINGLPYSIDYKELCIGKGCQKQFTLLLELKKWY